MLISELEVIHYHLYLDVIFETSMSCPYSPKDLLKESNLGYNVVIGVLDTGIWPDSPRFNDEGLGPVPTHFKGECNGGERFLALDEVDKAVKDGVDVLSISLGGPPQKYADDLVATSKLLGNQHYLSIVLEEDAGDAHCISNFSNSNLVKGKIVICKHDSYAYSGVPKGLIVEKSEGIGAVIANDEYYVAEFSSRGSNLQSVYVLKPDIIAPGVNILTARPTEVSPSRLLEDPRRSGFNIISGTSMACPHVSSIVALNKGAHLDWSQAMIKSALMKHSL
ncbi:hypothetical protein Cgig2_005742 [Carnegiea gigantea]|uniref:Peptidase S8/S53 domain-containing protein n=1 Tax=Carnegiea gigantea TaxID=171969 RepID=A0A9Q1QIX1_9CARY|nr:hypothetical protein Cgig2_005742 [Carnegiea gigantea]